METEQLLRSISVVVAFRGCERCVLDCLNSLHKMEYPADRLEIIVVDDHHDDTLADEIVQLFPRVTLLRNDTPLGCASTKRRGADISQGDIVAFTDADCTVSAEWAQVIARNMVGGADAVTGQVRHPRTFLRELVGIADFPDWQRVDPGYVDAFVGCNYAIRRDLLTEFKFKECHIPVGADRLESWQLHKAGYKIAYDPRMVVDHLPEINLPGILERRLRYGMKALVMRQIDPTLPGGRLAKLGPLAAPAYLGFKAAKDAQILWAMTRRKQVNRMHAPFLLPMLLLFRLLDAAGILAAQMKIR